MNGKWVLIGILLGVACFLLNRVDITLTSFLAAYTLSCDKGEAELSLSFFSVITILYNMKLYGLI